MDLPREFLNTPLGQQFAPMMMNMQNSLKVSSNNLFNEQGEQRPLQARSEVQQPAMPGMGGMPPAGGNMDPMAAMQ